MIRQIVEAGDPVLRSMSSHIDDPSAMEVRELARDMADTLKDFQKRTGYGRGIAAPQVGVPVRMIVVDMPELGGIATLVNPHITGRSPEMFDVWDACFSYFYLFFLVERHQRITVEYDDLQGTHHVIEAAGDLSELLQHEIEHLDGELAIDKVKDPRSFCTVQEFEKRVRKQS
ncbi:MAG: peptide deformylase [Bacillota bacterium]|nr:peptide deformylase [Bacillota bacterium]